MDGKEIGLTRTTQGRLTQTRHEYSNVFVKRRGAWASPNQPLVTRRTNAREEGLHTDTQGKGLLTHTRDRVSNAFVKREVHGQARTLPCYKTREHTRKRLTYTHERQSFECLCEKRGAWASPNAPLLQDTRTHKEKAYLHTRETEFRMPL